MHLDPKMVKRGTFSMKNLIIDALRKHLRAARERKLDAEFAKMRNDLRYRKLVATIASEFEHSDWDALKNYPGNHRSIH